MQSSMPMFVKHRPTGLLGRYVESFWYRPATALGADTGKVVWEFSTASPQGGNVIAAQRLPGGNTFIATYFELMEITPAKNAVYRINRGQGNYIFGVQRTRGKRWRDWNESLVRRRYSTERGQRWNPG